ncbi:MAG: Ig-like domain-containing domain [Microscillaceae bacterium]|nr:Ig-like domain-containing domain [Microscillaceae bacterium]MDW8460507.1 Ig-like domain-containing domain [Cytophagales bacterium]
MHTLLQATRLCFIHGILLVLISCGYVLFFTQCANQMAPTGGPKDTLAPKLLLSIPKNLATNYKGKKIVLIFDEWIRTERLEQELLITPSLKNYKVKEGKNKIEITLIDTLRANTTYNFNFREAIKDISERNTANNINIAFSTGNQLDSLQINGNVIELFTGKPLQDVIISLYPAFDTFRIDKHKPFYYTLSDKSGNFSLKHIREGTYQIYALKDKNNNGFYDEGELIAFLDSTLLLNKNINNLTLKLHKEDYTPPKYGLQTSPDTLTCEVSFSEGLLRAYPDSGKTDLPYFYEIKKPEGNSLIFYKKRPLNDSLLVQFIVYDSLNNRAAFERKIKFQPPEPEKKERKERKPTKNEKTIKKPKMNVQAQLLTNEGIEGNEFHWQLKFEQPIVRASLEKIQFWADKDTLRKKTLIENARDYQWNTAYNVLTIKKNINFYQTLHIEFDSTTFIGLRGDSCKNFKASYPKKDIDKYGTILGEVQTTQPHYIIQLLDSNFEVLKEQRNSPKKFNFSYLKAGSYFLRVLIDKNQDQQFNQGSYKQKKLPEDMKVFKVNPDVREKWDVQNNLSF